MIKFCYSVFDHLSDSYNVNWTIPDIDILIKKSIVKSIGNIGIFHKNLNSQNSNLVYRYDSELSYLASFCFDGVDKVGRENCKSAVGYFNISDSTDNKIFNIYISLSEFKVIEVFERKDFNIDIILTFGCQM